MADRIGIEKVYQLCAFLPLAGLLTVFLPRTTDDRTMRPTKRAV
jgi:FSR family fosmidomycin resistance protein-like MFS transporter